MASISPFTQPQPDILSDIDIPTSDQLAAQIEPFDSFWEGPSDIEKGYDKFLSFYREHLAKINFANNSLRALFTGAI